MTTFALTVKLGNDAMQSGTDVAETLRRVADRLEAAAIDDDDGQLAAGQAAGIRDLNGNTVGRWEVRP